MKHIILALAILPFSSYAQQPAKVVGLGKFVINETTSEALNHIDFEEEKSSGPCEKVKSFKAVTFRIADIDIVNLKLKFYENRLYDISCEANDELIQAFKLKYGPGEKRPTSRFPFCSKKKDKPMLIWGERWINGDVQALLVHTKGLNSDCEMEQASRFSISSENISKLGQECDSKNTEHIIAEFDKELKSIEDAQKQADRDRVNKIKKEL